MTQLPWRVPHQELGLISRVVGHKDGITRHQLPTLAVRQVMGFAESLLAAVGAAKTFVSGRTSGTQIILWHFAPTEFAQECHLAIPPLPGHKCRPGDMNPAG